MQQNISSESLYFPVPEDETLTLTSSFVKGNQIWTAIRRDSKKQIVAVHSDTPFGAYQKAMLYKS